MAAEGSYVITYPHGASILDREKFRLLNNDEIRSWLASAEANGPRINHYVRNAVFRIVLARKDFHLLKETCYKLHISVKDTYASDIAAEIVTEYPEIINYLNYTYWHGDLATLIIENMFYNGASVQEIKSAIKIVGMPICTKFHNFINIMSYHPRFSGRIDLFAWCWTEAWQGMKQFHPDVYLEYLKKKCITFLTTNGKQDLLAWVQANDP